jgi:hypothetical protein
MNVQSFFNGYSKAPNKRVDQINVQVVNNKFHLHVFYVLYVIRNNRAGGLNIPKIK